MSKRLGKKLFWNFSLRLMIQQFQGIAISAIINLYTVRSYR